MIASIVSMIFANATASGLAIELYSTPLASIRSTTPHANYTTPSVITNPYRSVATLAHASISSASAGKQDLLPLPTDYLNAGLLDYASYGYVPGAPYPFHSDFEPITETPSSTINATDVASITIAYTTTTVASNELAIESHPTPLASIRSTTSHANYTKPPTTTNSYHSAATFSHVSIASGGAVKQDFLPLPADYLDGGLLDYDSYASDAPCPFHSDSEPITKTPLPAINTTDVASITIAFADATTAVAGLHQHPGVIHRASIHRAPDQSAPLGVNYITRALDATYITVTKANQLAHIPTTATPAAMRRRSIRRSSPITTRETSRTPCIGRPTASFETRAAHNRIPLRVRAARRATSDER